MKRLQAFLPLTFLLAASGMAQVTTPAATPAPVPPPASAAEPSFDELIEIKATPYRPALTRDPFSAPTDAEQAAKGDLVEDMGVKGWVRRGGKIFLVATDSRGNVRSLPVGYNFRDGKIAEITEKAVTFQCWDINSTNRSAFRTVVKTFKREEGKR